MMCFRNIVPLKFSEWSAFSNFEILIFCRYQLMICKSRECDSSEFWKSDAPNIFLKRILIHFFFNSERFDVYFWIDYDDLICVNEWKIAVLNFYRLWIKRRSCSTYTRTKFYASRKWMILQMHVWSIHHAEPSFEN